MFGFHSGAEFSSVLGSWTVSLGERFLEIKTAQSLPISGLFTQQHSVTSQKTSVFRYLLLLFSSGNLCEFMVHFCICCRFAINLQCGPHTSPRDDIALHLAPRFSENYITRNSLQNMVWGVEENHGYMPLARGQGFEIIILCDPSHYKVRIKKNWGPRWHSG